MTDDRDFHADRATLYDHLIDYPKREMTAFYGTLASCVDMKASTPRFHQLLRSIHEREHYSGRPLLTAVVVSELTSMPGTGFFRFARGVGSTTIGGIALSRRRTQQAQRRP